MVRRPPSRSSVLIAISLLVAFVVWTWLTFNSAALAAFDMRTLAPPLDPDSTTAEIAGAFALLTWPGLEYAALAAIAIWAVRHRLRQLAVALLLVIILALGRRCSPQDHLSRRPRPEQALDLLDRDRLRLSVRPYDRRRRAVDRGCSDLRRDQAERSAPGSSGMWAQVCWYSPSPLIAGSPGAHYISDIVGGALYGALAATVALLVAGITVADSRTICVGEIVRSRAVAEGPMPLPDKAGRGHLQPGQGHRLDHFPAPRGLRAEESRLGARSLARDHERRIPVAR